MMIQPRWIRRAMGAAVLAATLGACDFAAPTAVDPNAVPSASAPQLFTTVQVNTFYWSESQLSRLAAMWTQQMAGTDRQFAILNQYIYDEEEADGEFSAIYTAGGLVDIRKGIAMAEEAGCAACAAMFRIHEAYLIGMGASVFGDMPYSQALAGDEFPTPELDEQADVYAAVQTLLDQAITELAGATPADGEAGTMYTLMQSADFNFGGDTDAWTQVANTLKARFHLHWAEANGSSAYTAALAAAQDGITAAAGNWNAVHSTTSAENNLWYQFMRDRSGYISTGPYLQPRLAGDGDPREAIYFDGTLLAADGVGAPGYDQPIATCAETQFIIAEAEYHVGTEADAIAAAQAGLACQEALFGIDLSAAKTRVGGLTGAALLEEIMFQKYAALFLNIEAWNDYKRTCLPAITPVGGADDIPGRMYYGQLERQTNPNIPAPGSAGNRMWWNDNDPTNCDGATAP